MNLSRLSISNLDVLASRLLTKSFWAWAAKNFFILVAVVLASLFISLTVVIYPLLSLIIFIPLLLWVFILLPVGYSYPKKLLIVLFYLWFVFKVLWPYYLMVSIPSFYDLYPTRIILAALVVIWIYFIFKSTTLKHNIKELYQLNKALFWALFFLILSKFWGAFLGGQASVSINSAFREIFEIFIPVLVFMTLFSKREELNKFVNVLVIAGIVVVLIGLIEFLLQKNPFTVILPASFFSGQDYIQDAIAAKIRGEYRLQSVFGHPLVLSQMLIVLLPFLLYKLFYTESKFYKTLLFLMIPVYVLVMYKTGSRSVFAGLIIEVLFFGLIYFYRTVIIQRSSFIGWLYVTGAPFLLVSVFLFVMKFKSVFMGQTNAEYNSTQARFSMWEKGINILANDPLGAIFGLGLQRGALILDWQINGVYTIDSYFLSVLLETGYTGLFIYLITIYLVFHVGFKTIKSQGFKDPLLITVLISLAGYLMVAFVLSLTHIMHLYYLLMALVLIIAWQSNRQEKQRV